MNKYKLLIIAGLLIISFAKLAAQTFLNGDFENNTAGACDYNLTNAAFNLEMPDANGFGPGNELDIMSYCSPYCDSAQQGEWYIALANGSGTSTDEVALTLSSPLIAGNVYTMSYWDHGEASGAYPPTPLNIGVSTVNNAMGTIIYTSPLPVVGVWTNRIVTFVAPVSGQYITINCDTSRWVQVDNFEILPIALIQNTCFGDSTVFTISNTNALAGVEWNFDDAASGVYNTSTIFNPTHYFTAPGIYNVQLIQYGVLGNVDTIYTTVTINAIPVINLGNDSTYCTGTAVLLNAGGGYTTYVWQDASTDSIFNATLSGTYFVTVGNNGCSATDSISLQFAPCSTPVINFSVSDTNFCEKQCIDFFDLSTNNPTSWQWHFSGANPDTSTAQNPTGICYNSYGNFAVTLIACNASGCDSLTINQFINEFQNPVDSIWSSNDTLYSLPFPSYQWYEVTSGLIAGATNQYYVPIQLGSYYCVVDDSIGCIATSNTITLTGSSELANNNFHFSINPNPVTDFLNLEIQINKNENPVFEIYDLQGRIIQTENITNENSVIDVRAISKGVYGYRISSANNLVGQGKFLKM